MKAAIHFIVTSDPPFEFSPEQLASLAEWKSVHDDITMCHAIVDQPAAWTEAERVEALSKFKRDAPLEVLFPPPDEVPISARADKLYRRGDALAALAVKMYKRAERQVKRDGRASKLDADDELA